MAEKILIVDDDLDTLKLVGLILQRQGYQIAAANGGLQALAKVAAERPDLILLDLMMPDLDGYEVARRIRADASLAHIPIIMFTAKTMLDDKVAGFEAGADDYLTKPTHPSELIAHVKALLARTQATRPAAAAPDRGRLIGLLAAKGGVGLSTVAVNMAAIASQAGQDVIVADLNLGSGSLSLMLNLLQTESLAGLLSKPAAEITARAVQDRLAAHPSGLRALAPPPVSSDRNLSANAIQLEAVVKTLQHMCKVSVLDLGAGLGEANRRIVGLCEVVVVVVEPTKLSVVQTKALLGELSAIGVSGNRLEVIVVNRAPASNQLAWQVVEQTLGVKVSGVITPAAELAYQSVEAGSPVVLLRPESLTADQLRTATNQLLQKNRVSA